MQLLQRLSVEATPRQMERMNRLYMFQDVSPHPMKDHCFIIISTLDEIINKLQCVNCIKEMMRRISDTHYINCVTHDSDLYEVNSVI